MSLINQQPIVILGGFLISEKAYETLKCFLRTKTNMPIEIIKANKFDWLLTNWEIGWKHLLDRVDIAVKKLIKISPTGKVTLIGHSSGGLIMRLFLSDKPFANQVYNGAENCNFLITLGSPNHAKKGTRLRLMVDSLYPGSFYKKKVQYISVAGRVNLEKDNNLTNFAKKSALTSYKSISGEDNLTGDGLVPIQSALLSGSKKIILDETSHGGFFGKYWYGSKERVSLWWKEIE
tara:strand:+ start:12151 stop:12852 length:702 start_codon:yes stop_codon:yes gene_type:complete